MKSRDDIARDLQELVARHYYSEDFELLSAVRVYRDGLAPAERDDLGAVALDRLFREGSIVDVLVCSVLDLPSAAPVLAARLDREHAPSQMSRALIVALQGHSGDDAFRAVERFLDSEQEHEALQALARIDFRRAAPYLLRALHDDHRLDLCLHILHDRRKRVGLDALGRDLRALAGPHPAHFRARVARALHAKEGPFNPFSDDERRDLLAALR